MIQGVNLICIGKLKEEYWRNAEAEYVKRLSAFCRLNIIELPEQKLSDKPSQAQIDNALEEEGSRILSKIKADSTVYALCIEGSEISSEKLSSDMQKLANYSQGNVVFIIGSSFGLAECVKKRADVMLSMSRMTFTHQLARIMLLEQIYRAYQITTGGKYHK